ncbi:MAG: hypothetical protein IAF94_24175 [Pirellulaceae bacterium]|nr:hypothetical protein [Pirellulaceae bacterium]
MTRGTPDALPCVTNCGPPQSLCPLGFWGVAAIGCVPPLTFTLSAAMHVRDLVELAARIAVSASSADAQSAHDPKGRSIQTYWSAARCRMDRWTRAIRRQGELILRGQITSREAWTRFEPLFQEILAAELVSRIAAAAAAASDARRKEAELEPVARSVFTAHLEVRGKVLQLLLTGERQGVPAAKQLNDLRRRVERWTDLLLAHLAPVTSIHDFAFEPNRAVDFADDLRSGGSLDEQQLARELLFSSFRGSLLSRLTLASPNADLNETIGRSLLALFGEDRDQPAGESGWLSRISRMTDDAQEMLDEIAAMEVG